jgi:hypothetical protein
MNKNTRATVVQALRLSMRVISLLRIHGYGVVGTIRKVAAP